MRSNLSYLRWPLIVVIAAVVAACASMGRPEGGPVDTMPPAFVKSRPAPSALNVRTDRIVIDFDENIQVDNPLDKVVVSPAQRTPAKITGVGHRVTVDLQDTLIPNTTYTIDFTNAIKDLNEGNELDGFAFAFSTGPVLDSLSISGMVFAAENLEPAQSMLVGVHSNLADSAITTLPFDRITRTNQLGQFTIRNLRPGTYHVFAVNDINRDNKWDRSEDIAFYPVTVSPTASRIDRADTIKAADGVTDSIVVRKATAFAPADLLLTWFNEQYKALYMSKNERRERNKIHFEMGAPSDTLPQLRFVGGPFDGEDFTARAVLDASPTRDTLTYWITDSSVIRLDSIHLAATYLRTDTLDNISWTTDTLNFSMRPEKKKDKKKKHASEEADTTVKAPPVELLRVKVTPSAQTEVYSPITLELSEPLRDFDPAAVHMEIMAGKDTVWSATEAPQFAPPDPYRPLLLRANYRWEPGAKYRMTIDSTGVDGIYGHHNGKVLGEFNVRRLEDYGSITFNITNLGPNPAFVQLLTSRDAPAYTVDVTGGEARFANVLPGVYYARLIDDRNGNRKWDTGSMTDSVQPEDVYYFPKKINLKKNWDISQQWDLYDTPVDLQKPDEIKKNKPKKKKGRQNQEQPDEEEDQYYDEFGNPAVDPDDPFGKRKNRNYNRTDRNNSVGRNGLGGNTIHR